MKDWKKEFNEKFIDVENPNRPTASIIKHPYHEDIKSFIESLLEQERKEIVQITPDGKYLSYNGKIYVLEDEKIKELINNKI